MTRLASGDVMESARSPAASWRSVYIYIVQIQAKRTNACDMQEIKLHPIRQYNVQFQMRHISRSTAV